MRYLCERPGSKCASITLAGNWGNSSVQVVFDGRLFPHADETRLCEIVCVNFHGDRLD